MIGERIRQARLLAGLTQEEVAKALTDAGHSATKAVVSKYENNKSVPKAALLLEMARILDVSSSYFLYEPETDVKWLAYRKHSALGAGAQEVVQGYARDTAALYVELRHLLYPGQSAIFPEAVNVTTPDEAEAAAANLRAEWKLGDFPVENLTQTAEENGVAVIAWKRDAGQFDGLSGWCGRETPVTVVNTAVDVDRRRFNLAHELGHLVMRTPDNLAEPLAHRFAVALLVPAEAAYRELGRKRHSMTLSELGSLKRRYGLSIQGWVVRAHDLEIITDHYAQAMFHQISARGWRKQEPYAYVADEEPVMLERMILRALAEGLVTPDRVRQALPYFTAEDPITETSGLPSVTELLAMSPKEREKWMQRSLEVAVNMDFEQFDAFGEEEF